MRSVLVRLCGLRCGYINGFSGIMVNRVLRCTENDTKQVSTNFTKMTAPSSPKSKTEMSLSAGDVARRAAAFACGRDHIRSGQNIGVGSGTTAKFLVDYLSEEYKSGKLNNIRCVPTSFLTRQWLINAGLPVSTLEEVPMLNIAIDGADEVDSKWQCIKGGGGCLTQEKVVQTAADNFIIIADKAKSSTCLGEKFKYLPIEVVPFAYKTVQLWIVEKFGGRCELRMANQKCGAVITDNNNYVLDWYFTDASTSKDWVTINNSILCRPGVVETGLFLNVVNAVYFGLSDGTVFQPKKE